MIVFDPLLRNFLAVTLRINFTKFDKDFLGQYCIDVQRIMSNGKYLQSLSKGQRKCFNSILAFLVAFPNTFYSFILLKAVQLYWNFPQQYFLLMTMSYERQKSIAFFFKHTTFLQRAIFNKIVVNFQLKFIHRR